MSHVLDFCDSSESRLEHYKLVRSQDKPEITLSNQLFAKYQQKGQRKRNITILEKNGENTKFSLNKPKWQRFEDRVWELFYELKSDFLPINDVHIEYDDGLKRQIDGLYSDENYVYIIECKYKEQKSGIKQQPGDVLQDVQRYSGIWKRLCKAISKISHFEGKTPIFILATYGIKHTKKLQTEVTNSNLKGILLDASHVESITKMTEKMGAEIGKTIFKQEIFKNSSSHSSLPTIPKVFLGTQTMIDNYEVFTTFVKPKEILELAYVPRRMPTGGDIKGSYQRVLKDSKVSQISTFLNERGSFFPNSVVCAVVGDKCKFISEITDEHSSIGKIELPNSYGCLWVIDGQHRIFGSAKSTSTKPINVTIIQGMNSVQQANMFTTINQKASSVDPDLLWDLFGELGSIDPPPREGNRAEEEIAIKYLISNMWKSINADDKHPLAGKIHIPSQSYGSKKGKISFGNTLCKHIFKKSIWEPGYLRQKSWKRSKSFGKKRISYLFEQIYKHMKSEWDDPKNKWLLSNSSMIALMIVTKEMVEFFGGLPSTKTKWQNDSQYHELIDEFAELLCNGIKSEESGFFQETTNRNILKAGNAAQRKEYAKDLIFYIRQNGRKKYLEFAPDIEEEDEGDYPSEKTKKRARDAEISLRRIIYEVFHENHGDKWHKQLNQGVWNYINIQIQEKKIIGIDYEFPYGSEILDLTATNHINEIIKSSSNDIKNSLFERFNTNQMYWDHNWVYFSLLRNFIAHHNDYGNDNNKQQFLLSLKKIEDMIKYALNHKNLEEE